MELITSIVLLSFFSFFYYLARSNEEFILEWLACFGIFLTGMLMFTTGVQAFSFVTTATNTTMTVLEDNSTQMLTTNTNDLILKEVPTAAASGIVFVLVGLILMLWSYLGFVEVRKLGAD